MRQHLRPPGLTTPDPKEITAMAELDHITSAGSAPRGFIADQICRPMNLAESSSDSTLLGLIERYMDLHRRDVAANRRYIELVELLAEQCPVPSALGRIPADLVGGDVRRIADWASGCCRQLGLSGLARVGKPFLAAVDAFETQIAETRVRIGIDVAFAELNRLDVEDYSLLEEIRTTPAQTITGIALKLRVLDIHEPFSHDPGPDDDGSDYWLDWKGELLRNAERLAGLPLSLPPNTPAADA